MKVALEVTTQVFTDGQIRQEMSSLANGARHRIQTSLIDTSEAQIRAALVLLGWTPPDGKGVDLDVSAMADVQLVQGKASTFPAPTERPMGVRLPQPLMVTTKETAGHCLNHIVEACSQGLREQGMALQDFALPALRWAILRIGVLEGGETRFDRRAMGRPSRPAPL